MMEKTFSAKTADEAKTQAIEYFTAQGFDEADVNFEILEQPIKKLFGGVKGEYVIKASADEALMIKPEQIFSSENTETEKSAPRSVKTDNNREKNTAKVRTEKSNYPNNETGNGGEPQIMLTAGEAAEHYASSIAYLTRILEALGAEDFKIEVSIKENVTVLDIIGDKLGIAIGRRGETLDSLQYLAILANNKKRDSFSRLTVDCNGYRERRRGTLEELAVRTAHKVLKQGRRMTLEPMNPYERRVIHSKISEIEGVYSNSIGEEPFRKVVISAQHPNFKPRHDSERTRDYNAGGGKGPGKRFAGDDRKIPSAGKSYKQSSGYSTSFEREYKREAAEISQDTADIEKNTSLYGKIEL